jgi:type II secretory pathway pseudopilin PulG
MKMRVGLRARLLGPVLLILGIGLMLVVFTLVWMTGQEFEKAAFAQNEATAQRYAQQVGAELGRNIEVARGLARTFVALKTTGVVDRQVYDEVLKSQLLSHPGITST